MDAAETVERNEHLLINILVSLPAKSVFRFMSVSTRWKKIIDNPFFRERYCRRRRRSCSAPGGGGLRLLAVFQKTIMAVDRPIYSLRPPMNILPIYSWRDHIKHIPMRFGRFINSSNGLILCCPNTTTYHVVNPVTGKWFSLPPPPSRDRIYSHISVGLMCEENTSQLVVNYTVVRALARANSTSRMGIQTYSSRTGEWAPSTLVAAAEFELLDEPPMVANGVFHWFAFSPTLSIVVHDPNNQDQNHAQLVQLPRHVYSIGRSPSDILWLGEIASGSMKIWMLPKGGDGSYRRATTVPSEEWVLMYDISVESTYKDIASTYIKNFNFQAFVSWDPLVALLKNNEALFLHNVESSKSGEMIRYHGRLVSGDIYQDSEFYQDSVCPFLECSSLSSYAL